MPDTAIKSGTVFIIQQPKPSPRGWLPDFSTAMHYGKLEYVFDADDRAYADQSEAFKKVMRKLARKFDPETDYLLCTNFGDPMCNYIATMMMIEAGFPRVKFLYWSKTHRSPIGGNSVDEGYYVPIEIDLDEIRRLMRE